MQPSPEAQNLLRQFNGLTPEQQQQALAQMLHMFELANPPDANPPAQPQPAAQGPQGNRNAGQGGRQGRNGGRQAGQGGQAPQQQPQAPQPEAQPPAPQPPAQPVAAEQAATPTLSKRAEWLKGKVDHKAYKTTNTILSIALTVNPAARVGLEGINKVARNYAEGRTDIAIREFLKYGLRTGAAWHTWGGSELAIGIWKAYKLFCQEDAQGNRISKKAGFAALGAALGISTATWLGAPVISNALLNTSVGTAASSMLEGIGNSTRFFRPDLAKAYTSVATRMALNSAVAWTGKKAWKERAPQFEAARSIVTGVFALEAFGQGLYTTHGNWITGDRPLPLIQGPLQYSPFNLSQIVGDYVHPVMSTVHENVQQLVDDPYKTVTDWMTPDSNTHDPLPPAEGEKALSTPATEFEKPVINPDGTVSMEASAHKIPEDSTSEQESSSETIPAHYSHPPSHGETIMVNYVNDMLQEAGIPGTDPVDFEVYKVDSTAVERLQYFINNPDMNAASHPVITQPDNPYNEHGTYVIGHIEPALNGGISINDIDDLSDTLLHHSRDMIDEAGQNLVDKKSPFLRQNMDFEFKYQGYNVRQQIDFQEVEAYIRNGGSLSDFVLEHTTRELGNQGFLDTDNLARDTDLIDTYKIAALGQFTDQLMKTPFFHDQPNPTPFDITQAKQLGFNNDYHIKFYEELAARIYNSDPQKAQYLFENRLNPDVYKDSYLILSAEPTRESGTQIIDMIKQGYLGLLPQSERQLIYESMTGRDGMLERSNNYFGNKDITTVIQLEDGTLLSFGASGDFRDEYPHNYYIHDFSPQDTDGSNITDELTVQIKELNPGLSQAQLEAKVMEAAAKLAEVAETHNWAVHIEDILRANPDKVIDIPANDEVTHDFKILYDSEDDQFLVPKSDGYQKIQPRENQLLLEVLSHEQYMERYLSGLNLQADPLRYAAAISGLKDSILSANRDLVIPTMFTVNGDPHFIGPVTQGTIEDPGEILGTIVGQTIVSQQGYVTSVDAHLMAEDVSEVPTSNWLYGKENPDEVIAKIDHDLGIGKVLAYNPAQLVVLDETGQRLIQGASRELAEVHLAKPDLVDSQPTVISLPLSQAGYTKDFTIQMNGGPINFAQLYTDIAQHINSNLRPADASGGSFVDPKDTAFQVFVNHHIISTLFPQLQAKDIQMDEVIDQDQLPLVLSNSEKLSLPISELAEIENTNTLTKEMIKLSLEYTVGRPTTYTTEGIPDLTPIAVDLGGRQAQNINQDVAGTIWQSVDKAGEYLRKSIMGFIAMLAGNPATRYAAEGSTNFAVAAVNAGTPIVQSAAQTAADIPTEYGLETADILYRLHCGLNSIHIGSFHPFAILDPMLAKPLGTIEYMAKMNQGHIPYSVSGVTNHVIDDFKLDFPRWNSDNPVLNNLPFSLSDLRLDSQGGNIPFDISGNNILTYQVQSGDSLAEISRMAYGSERYWPQIYELNRDIIENPRLIYRGEILRLPNINN